MHLLDELLYGTEYTTKYGSDHDFTKVADAVEKGTLNVALRPHEDGGIVIESLHVAPKHRGKGLASALIELIKQKYPGDVWVKARPFGDMPMTIEQLEAFYSRHGFKKVDNKDNMLYKPVEK